MRLQYTRTEATMQSIQLSSTSFFSFFDDPHLMHLSFHPFTILRWEIALAQTFLAQNRQPTHVALLEEDLLPGTDFLHLFEATAWLLEADQTLWYEMGMLMMVLY